MWLLAKLLEKGLKSGGISAFLMAKEGGLKRQHGESEQFTRRIKEGLGVRAKGRKVLANGDVFHLREREPGYGDDSCLENDDMGLENEYFWNVLPARSE
jgi:hypothetical protein